MPTPKDQLLYEKIKQNIHSKYKPSAYRSAMIVKEYKKQYLLKYKNDKAYEGKKDNTKGLTKWFNEVWLNQRGEIGYNKKGDIYRPTIRIDKDTPNTFSELSHTY